MMRLVAAALCLSTAALAAPPSGWKTCGGLPDNYTSTACDTATSTCATMDWQPSPGKWGCCPHPEAVQCPGGYTCCPKGTTCKNTGGGYSVVSHCVALGDDSSAPLATPELPPLRVVGDAADTVGAEVCKTGPPIPYSKTLKNVLVVGDSVSIGYTPFVAKVMAPTAFVQHSPWGGDGGAEETKYGAACIDNLVRAPDGTALSPDVLMFNWGLHNSLAGNCTAPCVPGQSGPPAEYAPYLEKIVASLLATPALKSTKLLFAITSPDLCNAPIDHIQAELNAQAAAIMKKNNIPTVDLYKAITTKCGAVPQAECFGSKGCFCPHCPANGGEGYSWLANSTIVPAITKLL